VALIEWIAARESYPARTLPAPPPVVEGETVGERTEEDSLGWTGFESAQEPSDAMTMVEAPPVAEPADEPAPVPEPEAEAEAEAEAELEPAEPEEAPEPEPEAEPEPELPPAAEAEPALEPEPEPLAEADADPEPAAPEPEAPRRRWWRREPDVPEADADPEAHEPPRHVRVLPTPDDEAEAPVVDSWEQGFDQPDEQTDGDAAAEVGEDTAESEPAVTVDAEPSERRRFRRR
jgi:hypothetical protein